MAMGNNLIPRTWMVAWQFDSATSSSSKTTHMTHTFTMTRTYETIIEVEADSHEHALQQLSKIDVYSIELEQCCVTEEVIKDENGLVINNQ